MPFGMTRKMIDCLSYIELRWQQDGFGPSYDEIKDHLGLKSKSGIHRMILALEERGAIRRLKARARAIEPTRQSQISVLLPEEVDKRLRLIAAKTQQTPEGYVARLIMKALATSADRAARSAA